MVALASLVAVVAPRVGSDARTVAALFPPWWTAAAAFEAAAGAGDVIRIGRLRTLVVVHSDKPALGRRLADAGALLVVEPTTLGLCGEQDR